MNWLHELFLGQSLAHTVLVFAVVAALGLAIGNVRIRGIGLGIAGVLFAGILLGHLGVVIDHEVLHFVQEFGLVLFVFTIGMQVGPSFFTSFQQQGLKLNLMAASIVLSGALLTVLVSLILGIDMAAAVGIFSGATTNTPALGAAGDALQSLPAVDEASRALPGLGYAVAYPFGILGIILAMIVVRVCFRINPSGEAKAFADAQNAGQESLQRIAVVVENENLDGLTVRDIPGIHELDVIVSRIKRPDQDLVANVQAETQIRKGDVLLAVGIDRNLKQFQQIVGRVSDLDLRRLPGPVVQRRAMVTRKNVLGRTIRQLGLQQRYGVTITRVGRAGIELTAVPELKLQFGDVLNMVGEENALTDAAKHLGDSLNELNRTHFLTIFVGMALGVVAGSYPFHVLHMPAPVKLGLAGGPLIAAIVLSRWGRIGPMVLHMPRVANIALRELGIILFLACVGLRAGERFISTLLEGDGLLWMACGVVITLVPLLAAGFFGRAALKLNFMDVCGVLSGSMTDPPALAFANTIAASDAPSVSYATVYPLTMILRIVCAQVLVLLFCG